MRMSVAASGVPVKASTRAAAAKSLPSPAIGIPSYRNGGRIRR
jgi:hypothetical protein